MNAEFLIHESDHDGFYAVQDYLLFHGFEFVIRINLYEETFLFKIEGMDESTLDAMTTFLGSVLSATSNL